MNLRGSHSNDRRAANEANGQLPPDVQEYVARWSGIPRVLRQVLASLELVRLSSAGIPFSARLTCSPSPR